MTKKAGLVGTFSNHSGKRSCVTTLFQKLQNNVASHEIKVRTGNRSTVGVETYISASTEQQIETSRALEPPWSKAAKMPVCATVSVPPVIKLEPAATISMPDASQATPDSLIQHAHLQPTPQAAATISSPAEILPTGFFNNCTINLTMPKTLK